MITQLGFILWLLVNDFELINFKQKVNKKTSLYKDIVMPLGIKLIHFICIL